MASLPLPLLLFLASTLLLPLTIAEDASIRPEDNLPEWQKDQKMTMEVSTPGDIDPYPYVVVPLTETLGLNQTETTRGAISIEGFLVQITPENFEDTTEAQSEEVAYVSCDDPEDSDVTANEIVNKVMERVPKAIILYSVNSPVCVLEGEDLGYGSIFTFFDAGDSQKALNILNSTDRLHVVITGDATSSEDSDITRDSGNHSAVAMSVLYSITGLITMLFLVIIATGAIRARRYPERYGPRGAYGGQPRQSRAKGIARAVLDTIPIIKFGDPNTTKDANYDLDSPSIRTVRDVEAAVPTTAAGSSKGNAGSTAETSDEAEERSKSRAESSGNAPEVENLDCSICTEKFVVGEDVRVLPCNHKFHPNCIDPWLTEVSGTCPLCRLDLRQRDPSAKQGQKEDGSLPPPLEMDSGESDAGSTGRRRSRFFDISRLRHASAEERIQALRQLRRSQPPQDSASTSGDSSDRSRRAKMAERLRDKFRIKTRPQSPEPN